MAGRVQRLTASQQAIAQLARNDLAFIWESFSHLPPAHFHELLEQTVTELASRYGNLAGHAAQEWYRETRKAVLGGDLPLTPVEGANLDAVRGSVKWLAGDLYQDGAQGDGYAKARSKAEASLGRHVHNAGRSEIVRQSTAGGVRFGRLPRGISTCKFCLMLASRGFVYASEESAGQLTEFHDECDCEIVSEIAYEGEELERYRAKVKLYEQHYAEGANTSLVADTDALRHILSSDDDGGGHQFGAGKPGKTEFPERWDDSDVEAAVYNARRNTKPKPGRDGSEIYEAVFDGVLVRVIVDEGRISAAYPLRGNGVFQNKHDGTKVRRALRASDPDGR